MGDAQGDVDPGPIRINRSGLGVMVARCPLKVALKIIKNGKISMG